jgi:hypothetical protein
MRQHICTHANTHTHTHTQARVPPSTFLFPKHTHTHTHAHVHPLSFLPPSILLFPKHTHTRACTPLLSPLPPSYFSPNTHNTYTYTNLQARAAKRPKKCKKYQNHCHMFVCKYRHKAKNVSLKTHTIKLSLHNLKITAKSGI